MGASFLCGLIRIPDFVQNLFLNKKSYRLYIGIIYSSQKRREAVKLSYNRKRIKANKMMTGKNVMNSGIEQKINHAMEGMQKELQQKSWSRLEKFSKPENIKIYEEHLFSALNSMENEKLDNWTYKLKNKFKNWKFYRPEVTRTIDEKSLQTADYIYFFTDIMSHGSYCRYIKFVREYGLKFGYLHTINIESNINQIYEDIQNLEK